MQPTQIPKPPAGFSQNAVYRIKPREKRSFSSVLDARKLVAENPAHETRVTVDADGGDVVVTMEHTLLFGKMREVVRCAVNGAGLLTKSFERVVEDAQGALVRREEIPDFAHDKLGLPPSTYPEVVLPFVLGWTLASTDESQLYAWINDRFVARLYVEVVGRTKLDVLGKTHDVVESVMYPDLNDWVPMGRVLSGLAKPFIPKYRIWFAREAPHRLVRFEGPYGPPGAPEIVLELQEAKA